MKKLTPQDALELDKLRGRLRDFAVPFGMVQVKLPDDGIDGLRLNELPVAVEGSPSERAEINYTLSLMKLSEWGRLTFYYLSWIPNPQTGDHGISDGLLGPQPRPISRPAAATMHALLTSPPNIGPVIPSRPTICGLTGNINILSVFTPRPRDAFALLDNLPSGFAPEFLEFCPAANWASIEPSMVEGITYSIVDRTVEPPICRSKRIDNSNRIVVNQDRYIDASLPWYGMVWGDNFAQALLNAYQLQCLLPPHDQRAWRAPGSCYPRDWLVRDIDDPIPPHPAEQEAAERKPYQSPGTLDRDRGIFWNWQSACWTWREIIDAAERHGPLAGPKADADKTPDRTKTAKRHAAAYGEWIGVKLRKRR